MSKIIPMQAFLDKPLDIVSGNPDYEKLILDLDLIDTFGFHAKLEDRTIVLFTEFTGTAIINSLESHATNGCNNLFTNTTKVACL